MAASQNIKKPGLILLSVILASTLSYAQEKQSTAPKSQILEKTHIQRPVPDNFFSWEDYNTSAEYDSVCNFRRWASLSGDYTRHITSSGMWEYGTIIGFCANNRFHIYSKRKWIGPPWNCPDSADDPYGDYRMDTTNDLLYMRWDTKEETAQNNALFCQGIVCKINYYRCKKDHAARYKEALLLYWYVGATWDTPVNDIKNYPTAPVFEILVR